ncbi:MAG: hypothetical protein HQ541_07090, partial [Mariniphaga sp.]|nr:hypothetical protein [Mariniphaga sp.]
FVQYLEKHPEKQKEFELFQNTILFPDESVVFRKKSKLLKLTTGQKIWSYTIRIAAVLVLVFSFSILLKQHSEIDVPPSQIVKVATITPEIETTQKPQKEVKKDPKKIPSKPVVKDTIKVESTKSIRENNKGRIEGEDFIAFHRDSIVDKYLIAKVANISVNEPIIALMEVDQFILPDYFNEISEREVLLAERIKRKTGLDKFRLNDITKAGLKLFANISKNKFTYDTNEEGNITELNFETRLLAFSIPTKGNPE